MIDLLHFGQAYGKLLAWSGLGVIAGALIAVIALAITEEWRSLPFFIGAGIQLCCFLFLFFMVRETLGRNDRLNFLLSPKGSASEDGQEPKQHLSDSTAEQDKTPQNDPLEEDRTLDFPLSGFVAEEAVRGEGGDSRSPGSGGPVPFSWERVKEKLNVPKIVRILGTNQFVLLSAIW